MTLTNRRCSHCKTALHHDETACWRGCEAGLETMPAPEGCIDGLLRTGQAEYLGPHDTIYYSEGPTSPDIAPASHTHGTTAPSESQTREEFSRSMRGSGPTPPVQCPGPGCVGNCDAHQTPEGGVLVLDLAPGTYYRNAVGLYYVQNAARAVFPVELTQPDQMRWWAKAIGRQVRVGSNTGIGVTKDDAVSDLAEWIWFEDWIAAQGS